MVGIGSNTAGGHIKGVAIEHLIDWLAKTNGVSAMEAIVASLPAEDRQALGADQGRIAVLASSWYDAGLVHRLLDKMTAGMDAAGKRKLAEGAAEAIVRTNLRGVYKVLFQLFMTPERYAGRAQALWERYFDTGIVKKSVDGPKQHTSHVTQWLGHHPLLCELNALAGKIIYEELGCKNVRVVRTRCIERGDSECTQIITWS